MSFKRVHDALAVVQNYQSKLPYKEHIEKHGYYPLNEEEHKLVVTGIWLNYLNAIKSYRVRTGVDLRTAKDAVDAWSGIEGKSK